ncbi:class I SAM-dependent methyltransferase [Paracidovorax oryzae]|uniref:class I SAM-dependent methyltransferase n=1 Tax=Paracidovorax oryzae TaxID=862720 RepID=UPI000310529D|nr:class I SAM-dependent methyltransferase [Paracidovorax oryzae]
MDEKTFLESLAATYTTADSPQDAAIRSMAMRAFTPHFAPHSHALELGCDFGYMIQLLAPHFESLTVVDGSSVFLQKARSHGIPNAVFIQSLFEEFESTTTYEHIFLSYVLEHVIDPRALLRKVRTLLAPRGKVLIVVPNARALSRQMARHMGLVDDLYELTDNDRRHGHRRTYDRVQLARDISAGGLSSMHTGGLMLKPFADFQMNAMFAGGILGATQLEGLYQLGLEYPDLAGSLFSICCAAS